MKKKYYAIASVLLILGVAYISGRSTEKTAESEKIILSEHQLEPYLNLKGWKVTQISAEEVRIPQSFEGRYLDFSEVVKESGFDLSSHKGESVMRYTYAVENYGDDSVIAELLLTSDNELISASLIQQKQDGFIKAV